MTPPTRLAAWLGSYRRELKQALHSAAGDGFRVVQAAAAGQLEPGEFSGSAARHLGRYLRDLGLTLETLAAEFPGPGLADPRLAEQRVDQLRQTLELCRRLGVRRAATRIGGFADEGRRPLAEEMLALVAEEAERCGVRVALQAGDEDPALLAGRVRGLDCPGVLVGLDSASWRPGPRAGEELAGLVGLVHLRDVRRCGLRVEEVPFGQGQVDFSELLGRLAEAGYGGVLTIRRDAAGLGIDALRQGREYVESLLGGLRSR